MALPPSGTKSGASRRTAAQFLLPACVLGLLAGCHLPAAHYPVDCPGTSTSACCRTLACQLACDSTAAFVYRPVQTVGEVIAVPSSNIIRVSQGVFEKRVILPLHQPLGPVVQCHAPGDVVPDATSLPPEKGEFQPAHVQLYVDGPQALAALESVIEQAACSIDVLMFQWESDPVGTAIAERLAAKARQQVRVRVLVDGGGNLCFGHPAPGHEEDVNGAVRTLARNCNVEVIRNRNPFFRFDHRKLVIADGRTVWSGGRNFLERAFLEQHDLSFTVEGPLVSPFAACFERSWREEGGRPGLSPCQVQPTACGGALAVDQNAWNAAGRLVLTEPAQPQIERSLYAAVDRACHHVYMENFTFSDSCLLYKLAQARRRGVDVRVVTTIESTTPIVNHTNRVTANRLLRAGIRVYLYPRMTHVKAAVMDGCWAYIGTANFDPLSLRRNHELGLVVCACPLVTELQSELFLPDFCPEWELTKPLPCSPRDYLCEMLSSLCL
jgi:cardiolipin synthase